MKTGKIFIFSAPSGSGKSTIIGRLLSKKELNLEFSISATSRSPRGQEQDGKDYYFLSVEDFREKIARGNFLEWEEVYPGTYYGTLRSEVERVWGEGKNIVFDVDVVGGVNIKKMYPERSLSVFICPPSLQELRRRLLERGTDSPQKIAVRLEKAEQEMAYAPKFDRVLLNDDLERAVAKAEEMVLDFCSR